MISDAGEDVEDLAFVRSGVLDAVRGQQRKLKCFRKRDGLLVDGFFVAVEVALKLDVDVVMPEDADQTLESLMAGFVLDCAGERAVPAAGR